MPTAPRLPSTKQVSCQFEISGGIDVKSLDGADNWRRQDQSFV
ncbi:hypothetical protein CEV34_3308 [Brucella pseudogrignonensis]|uniref:Uncharacterized protein n=1 Tax=Brucella pseudogrignonensis TaxID=419475 RepID=A0A256GA24_9HYPH|nr:hypothetical protein CEV34_3308 [Brucella pseudogrignonensis]